MGMESGAGIDPRILGGFGQPQGGGDPALLELLARLAGSLQQVPGTEHVVTGMPPSFVVGPAGRLAALGRGASVPQTATTRLPTTRGRPSRMISGSREGMWRGGPPPPVPTRVTTIPHADPGAFARFRQYVPQGTSAAVAGWGSALWWMNQQWQRQQRLEESMRDLDTRR